MEFADLLTKDTLLAAFCLVCCILNVWVTFFLD